MENKQKTLNILACELKNNHLNSTNPEDYTDGIYGMNLIVLLQFLVDLCINTDNDSHKALDEMIDKYKIPESLSVLMHNTIEDFYL